MAKKKEVTIIMSPQLETVLKGYVPTSANIEDINIVKALEKLHGKLKTIDNVAFRKAQKERTPLTSKMQEIQRDEEGLIRRITVRNMDF